VTTSSGPPDHKGTSASRPSPDETPQGIVAGAVLRAARLSAQISESRLSALANLSEAAVRAWEDGYPALSSAAAPAIRKLEAALIAAGADRSIVADLYPAAWCDLVIQAIQNSEDLGCLLADQLAAEHAFRELLAWSIDGTPPERYRRFASTVPLLHMGNSSAIAEIAHAVIAGLPQPGAAAS
jgi:DNA-binding transcriptional regulator YiaG